MVMKSTY